MDEILINEIARIRNLKNYKDLPDEELERIARINLKLKDFKAIPLFDSTSEDGAKEQDLAEKRYRLYLETHEIESVSDLDTLRSLVFTEIFESRIQQELNKQAKEEKYPPEKLTKQLLDLQNQKSQLKIKLGIDKTTNKVTDLTHLQQLEKKFQDYYQANMNEFTTICGCCGELLLLRRRVKEFDCVKHPWFAGRWLFNYPLLKMVKNEEITKEKAWEILCAASKADESKAAFSKEYCIDYINYCLEHWAEINETLENRKL